jgi:hypothetical protein
VVPAPSALNGQLEICALTAEEESRASEPATVNTKDEGSHITKT